MLDRLDADAVSLSFGGLKNTVLLPDFAVIGILNFDQKQPPGMQICSDFDLPSVCSLPFLTASGREDGCDVV